MVQNNGYVLRAPRSATSNFQTTDEAASGVIRDYKPIGEPYKLNYPELSSLLEDQYKTAVLLQEDKSTEYLIWAANDAAIRGGIQETTNVQGTIPSGTRNVIQVIPDPEPNNPFTQPVENILSDGTLVVFFSSEEGTISEVLTLTIRRGDTGEEINFPGGTFSFQDKNQKITITSDLEVSLLGGGLSRSRGDTVLVTVRLSGPKFWWTKNDQVTRFGWNGTLGRWAPLRGSSVSDLGQLLSSETYTLSPFPSNVEVGDTLSGDPNFPDQYSMVRVGVSPDENALSVRVSVKSEVSFDGEDAILLPDGTLEFNPSFIDQNAGLKVWYYHDTYQDIQDSVGRLGENVYVSPVPRKTEHPFIRIGNRLPLQVKIVENETLLGVEIIEEGEVGVALSTGKLKFSQEDLDKADPTSDSFDIGFLGAEVFYDGISLSQEPLSLTSPVPLVGEAGFPETVSSKNQLYVPNATATLFPGRSGVRSVLDRTGETPNSSVSPGVRPNGSGLVRSVDSVGDIVLFGSTGQIKTLRIVESRDDVPKYRFKVPKGTAYLNLQEGQSGSEIFLGKEDRKLFFGQQLYFGQAEVTPAVAITEAIVPSLFIGSRALQGTETLTFRINDDEYLWDASTDPGGLQTSFGGTFSSQEIADSLNAVITGNGSAVSIRNQVYLQSDVLVNNKRVGEIEIGYGLNDSLEGNAALGFLPGCLVRISANPVNQNLSWVPDNGSSLGVFRSPVNLDGRKTLPDVRSLGEYDDIVVYESIPLNPVILLQRSPLEDFPGYDSNIYFQAQIGLESRLLNPYEQIVGDFARNRFFWADENRQSGDVHSPTLDLPLDRVPSFQESFSIPSKGLKVSKEGSAYENLKYDKDFIVENNSITFIETVGDLVSSGGLGSFSEDSNIFEDTNADFSDVLSGYQLDITNGGLDGTYLVEEVLSPTSLRVSPSFSFTGQRETWALYEGISTSEVDSGIIADVQYGQFNHLTEDPFRIRLLSPIGTMPLGSADQQVNRRQAILGEALRSNRQFNVRIGESSSSSPTLNGKALEKISLGVVINGSLQVPNIISERFSNGDFSILIGSVFYTFEDNSLVKVNAFTDNLQGNLVEVRISDGELQFGQEVFEELENQTVVYVEEFLDPDNSPLELPQGIFEYDSVTGSLNFSVFDMADDGGEDLFFVELMNTENGDLVVNPLQGSLLFDKPLRENQRVEADYFLAENGTGDLLLTENAQGALVPTRVIEFLPRRIDLEETTYQSDFIRLFNPENLTVDVDLTPAVYIGSTLCNVGSSPIANIEGNQIVFESPVSQTSQVRISYFVFEAAGGEQTFTTTQNPIYRPPFKIEAGRTSFVLEGDRTSDLTTGQLLRVAQFPFYITGMSYNQVEDATIVNFIPETLQEAGSRDPSTNSLSLLTDRPIALGLSSDASEGFWLEIKVPYEPLNRGVQNIIFEGDLTNVAIAGHVLELAGIPFLIAGSSIIDNSRTQIDITGVFTRGFNSEQDVARISVRPIYPSGSTFFLGRGALLSERPFTLIKFPPNEPGQALQVDIDFTIDFDTGSVELFEPLQLGESLYLRQTKRDLLAPVLREGLVINPRYIADYTYTSRPSVENGLLGVPLKAKYVFENPDTFYYRIASLGQYLGEVAEEVVGKTTAQLPSSGSPSIGFPALNNQDQGRRGLLADISNLEDQDRAARVFIEFYDKSIQAFEQILESINGQVIGDRDGKFRFFVGRDNDNVPPGYEDPISGRLNNRNIFSELWFAYNRSILLESTDPLVQPQTAEIIDGDVVGRYIGPDLLDSLKESQRDLVQNDIDDIILTSRTRKKLQLFPLRLEAFGKYSLLGQPSEFSRLFPQRTEAFTLLDPGIGADLESDPIDPGEYAFSKYVGKVTINGNGIELPQRASTFNKTIGDIGNPVLGNIENISSLFVEERRPRAIIYAYSATGFPQFDTQIISNGGIPFTGNPRPAIIATPLRLRDFPLNNNGDPDIIQLAAQGGEVIDLTTGDPDLFTPAFFSLGEDSYPKVVFGKPDNRVIDVTNGQKNIFEFPPGANRDYFESLYIGEVLLGCILTFVDQQGNTITSPFEIQQLAEDPQETNGVFIPQQGDTIFIGPSDVNVFIGGVPNDPITQTQRLALTSGQPDYRIGFDLKVDRKSGEFRDISLPSFFDPSPLGLKETFGQRPPEPLSTIEAEVTFTNTSVSPIQIPALLGQDLNDSGDRSIPYISISDSEISLLGQAQDKLGLVFEDSVEPGAIYPNEIVGTDGEIFEGALTSSQDFLPGYQQGSGTADVRSFDFFFVQTGQGTPNAIQGMLSVGKATNNSILVPRFVSPTSLGSRIRYAFNNALAFVNEPITPNPPGMIVSRVGNITTFDITSISTALLVFNDGTPAVATGGLNDILDPGGILAYPNNGNAIRINLFNPVTDTFLQTITIDVNGGAPQVTGDLGTEPLLAVPAFTDNEIQIQTANPFVTVGFGGSPELPEDSDNPGQSLPIEFTIDVDTSSGNAGSFTGQVLQDRVTFREAFDLRTVQPRFIAPIDGFDVTGNLEIFSVTGSGTDALTINNAPEVNGGSAFTFWSGGDFNNATGTIEVPAFEGHNNSLISESNVIFSALASSDYDDIGVIAQGTGEAESSLSATDTDFRISNVSVAVGRVVSGDVVVINEDASGDATTKAGTYLVKHAIDPNVGNYRSIDMETRTNPANSGVGFAQPVFPKLVLVDIDNVSIQVDTVTLSDGSSAWLPSGRLFFVRDVTNVGQTISIAYIAVDTGTNTFTIQQGTGEDASGANVSDSEFENLPVGTLITGFQKVEINFAQTIEESLPRNLVGDRGDGSFPFVAGGTGNGFREIRISNVGASTFTYEIAPGAPKNIVVGAPGFDQIGVTSHVPIANTSFVDDSNAIVYENVCHYLDISQIAAATWQTIHGVINVLGLFPGDLLEALDFRAQGGIFLEPSVPRPVQDYTGINAKVVDAGHSLNANQIGFRDGPTYGAILTPELISFEVRRIRRFHDVLSDISETLEPLRYVYQKRTGVITDFGPKPVGENQEIWPYVVTANGTNLGPFDDTKVNVNPNDLFRLLDNDGNVLEQIEIAAIQDGENLLLKAPGIQDSNPVGKSFEVYLKKAPVPHEQSYDQLLDLITDEELVRVTADYVNQTGGQVPVEADPFDARRLLDNDVDFVGLGIQENDIIIIDPAGPVQGPTGIPTTGQERGSRSFGDRSVPTRVNAENGQEVPFIAGQPSEFDDNRGWYRVSGVDANYLTVSSDSEYSSDPGGENIIFGDVVQYSVLPTISGSEAPFASPPGGPGVEGQMDLRPTAFAGQAGSSTNSFSGNPFSIAPFSYRVIRTSPLFSEEAIDLILLGRERTLSWIEEFDVFFSGDKTGSYFVFQKYLHISDLGNPLIPEEGLGVVSNELVNNIRGEVDISPFVNTTDGLSVLDRRFWILDQRLDKEFPPNQIDVPSYAALEESINVPGAEDGDGRPVLTDLISDVLDNNDRFREKRYFWIDFRVNRESGSLTQIESAKAEFSKRKQNMIRRLDISEDLEE